jgi:hypothetical protein
MIETVRKVMPQKDAIIGFHSPYIVQMNHLHMHALRGEVKGHRWRFFLEFGNRLFFKKAEDMIKLH